MIMKEQPHVGNHVLTLRLSSLLNPLATSNIAEYLDMLFQRLICLRRLTLCFEFVRNLTARTQEETITMLQNA